MNVADDRLNVLNILILKSCTRLVWLYNALPWTQVQAKSSSQLKLTTSLNKSLFNSF